MSRLREPRVAVSEGLPSGLPQCWTHAAIKARPGSQCQLVKMCAVSGPGTLGHLCILALGTVLGSHWTVSESWLKERTSD